MTQKKNENIDSWNVESEEQLGTFFSQEKKKKWTRGTTLFVMAHKLEGGGIFWQYKRGRGRSREHFL